MTHTTRPPIQLRFRSNDHNSTTRQSVSSNVDNMSDMELSGTGEDGDCSEDYSAAESIYQDNGQHSISIQTHYARQGENLLEKPHNARRELGEHRRMVDITRDKPVKVTVRVVVPVRDHPKFNFVGKLLGPKGNSLKRLQEDTMTKMAILGRGSMRDKHKEEELRLSGDPKFSHLHDDLHVEITAFAPPAEAHARIAYALADVRRFLVPDYNDDIRQEQMWEMQILKERPDNTQLVDPISGHVMGVPSQVPSASPNSTHSPDSQSPHTPPPGMMDTAAPPGIMDSVGPPILLASQHPALHGMPVQGVKSPVPVVAPNLGAVSGRKRPHLPGTRRYVLSPTKRTVMSILARARAAQAKDLPGYHVNGNAAGLMGIRHDGTLIGANLV